VKVRARPGVKPVPRAVTLVVQGPRNGVRSRLGSAATGRTPLGMKKVDIVTRRERIATAGYAGIAPPSSGPPGDEVRRTVAPRIERVA
jgi:hypothetical protein